MGRARRGLLTGTARLTGGLNLYQPPGRVNPDVSLRLHGVRASAAAAGSVQSGILLGATDAGATPGTSLKGAIWYQEGTSGFGRGSLLLCQNSNADATNAGPANAVVTVTNTGNLIANTTSLGNVGISGFAGLVHSNFVGVTGGAQFCVAQAPDGTSYFNASNVSDFRINNSAAMKLNSNGLCLSSSGATAPAPYVLDVAGQARIQGALTAPTYYHGAFQLASTFTVGTGTYASYYYYSANTAVDTAGSGITVASFSNGVRFFPPVAGIWSARVTTLVLPNNSNSIQSFISKNDTSGTDLNLGSGNTLAIHDTSFSNVSVQTTMNATTYLGTGDFLCAGLYSFPNAPGAIQVGPRTVWSMTLVQRTA